MLRPRRRWLLALAAVLVVAGLAPRPFAAQALRPIVILVSIDGFRWDYFDRADIPTLHALAARGVRSQGLIPSFPSVTFPNHYTIVTGLYPDHHGIIANTMFDPRIGPEKFTMSSATAKDPRWWSGEPVWTTNTRQGGRSASMFWPGSEAVKPDDWRAFDDNVPGPDRVRQVLEWLARPEAERPNFVTLYFSDVDHAGHDAGPDSDEVLEAAWRVDDALAGLVAGVRRLGLADRVTYVVVSDHGMASTSDDRVIYLDDYLDPADIEVVDWTPNVAINSSTKTPPGELYARLKGRHPALAIYRKSELPSWLHYGSHPRIPEVVGIAEVGWTVTTHAAAESRRRSGRGFSGGAHGYDPRYREVHGLFIAAGPSMRQGLVAPEFQNIHIYNLLCRLLGIIPAPNDGNPEEIAAFFVR
jgi:predicted AlkP superfamily pyrophosphatase or phosphodiesterase